MKTLALIAGVACLSLTATTVLAQANTTTTTTVEKKKSGVEGGAAAGAIGGAMVAGPVGAVVGAVGGAVVGAAVSPPSEVRTYVTTQTNVPPVTYADPIVVGKPITGEITWLDVPSYPKYRWAYLNGQRVVIDNDTHNVVAVYR